MTLRFYNTLTRKKEDFTPADPKNVRMYVCGPTVYARPHIGNARSVVVYDVLYRLLKHVYGEKQVTYVRNITDVDDKINVAAIERGISIQALTQEITGWFHEDMDALNCLRPTKEPKATEHIPQMITMIEKLIANGNAYVSEGHVLFAVNTDPNYGKLSGRVQDDLKAGARVEVESYKRDAGDFVLWKPVNPKDDVSSVFDSPWGKGRPGWHIECSAMSTEYLGQDFDLHGGGSDLMFPHHENEIAQSCCANPKSQFAKYWVHNGFLTVNGEKMSKSLGNFITVKDLLDQDVNGQIIRYTLLSANYSKPLDWNEKLVADSKLQFEAIVQDVLDEPQVNDETENQKFSSFLNGNTEYPLTSESKNILDEFVSALSDDLNFSRALATLNSVGHSARSAGMASAAQSYSLKAAMKYMCDILGFDVKKYEYNLKAKFLKDQEIKRSLGKQLNVPEKIQARIDAKKAKNWAEADRIRKELSEQGIILEDKPDGTTDWRRA